MRVLKPDTAKERKEKILNWLIYSYITNGKPVSSHDIFNSNIFNLSPATIRNILKELDEEGYLKQVHTSGGRIPTDKAYRVYIDNLLKLQNLAEKEKEKIEIEYEKRISELDYFLKHTSKIISDLTKKIGFSMIADISRENIKRIDIVKVSHTNYIFIIVTESGLIRHYPFIVRDIKINVRGLISSLNKKLANLPIIQAREVILKDYLPLDESGIFKQIYEIFVSASKQEDEIFLEGISTLWENIDDFSAEDLRNIARLLEEKERFAKIIKERFEDNLKKIKAIKPADQKDRRHLIDVSIGSENNIKELNNFTLITSSYCLGEKNMGIIGVMGHKRMEYPKVISIIDSLSLIIEDILNEWEKEFNEL